MTKNQLEAELQKTIVALNVNPKNLQLWVHKSQLYEKLGQPEDSVETLVALANNLADKALISQVYEMAVEVCSRHGLEKTGLFCSEKYLQCNPESAKALFFRGKFLYERQCPYHAIQFLKEAVELAPDNMACWSFLGKAYSKVGMSNTAAPCFDKCVSYDPIYGQTYNALFGTEFSEAQILEGHRRAAQASTDKLNLEPLPASAPSDKAKPRVGFVSADFFAHSVGFYFQSVLTEYFAQQFDVFLYSTTEEKRKDRVTASLQSRCKAWRDVETLAMQELAELIQQDSLDVLVDLSGYMKGNRLQLFALRPAPVQLHYIGYPHTTGMKDMDYRIVDELTDPEGLTEKFTTEKLLRLNGCFLCYTPYDDAPDVSELPSASGKSVCFGSFNNVAKVNDVVLASWVSILNRVADSSLFIKSGPLVDELFREYLYAYFEEQGIVRDRIRLLAWTADREEHLGLYEAVDIHLDSFPYNGTTTTCEAAWQGVPTVTFKGDSHRARVGYSLMKNMGLEDFVADDLESYIELAVTKASDTEALAETRRTLRDKMRHSRLMDVESYSKDLAALFTGILPK